MISLTKGTGARRISIAPELPVAFDLIAGAVSAPYAGPLFVRRQTTPHSITRTKRLFAISRTNIRQAKTQAYRDCAFCLLFSLLAQVAPD
jgi:hypothetical protein